MLTRRAFLRTGALAAGALAFPSFLRAQGASIPIAPEWTGDEFDFPHELIQGGPHAVPAAVLAAEPERRFDVIVVGAGVSGLAAAFRLRDLSVLALESASRGGNAKKESWRGIDYALGSAYLVKPDPGEPLAAFYEEAGADKVWRISSEGGTAFHRNRLVRGLWENGTSPANRDGFRRARDYFVSLLESAYPEVPFSPEGAWAREEFERLDRTPFDAHLRAGVTWQEGGLTRRLERFDPAVLELLEYYCVSSFGGRLDEISAWYGLDFFAAEFGEIGVLPGGNAGLVDLLSGHVTGAGGLIEPSKPVVRIDWDPARSRARVISATRAGEGIDYHIDEARAVVVATSKFIAGRIVDMPSDQREAAETLEYRPYVVANALVERGVFEDVYDAYVLDGFDVTAEGFGDRLLAKAYTDVLVAGWAQRHSGEESVLTLYRGIPDASRRADLLDPGSLEAFGRPAAEGIAALLVANGVPAASPRFATTDPGPPARPRLANTPSSMPWLFRETSCVQSSRTSSLVRDRLSYAAARLPGMAERIPP